MKLARMQDIGGIRAVVQDMRKVRELEQGYKKGTKAFTIVKGERITLIHLQHQATVVYTRYLSAKMVFLLSSK
jgi:hypothetical protein